MTRDDPELGKDGSASGGADLRPIPRIAIQAFCETADVARALEQASQDRRMAKTHTKVHMGGISAAVEFYASAPTPNLLIVETRETRERALAEVERLAPVCDPGTKVLVIGHNNDVSLYRDLIRRGVSDYVVAPINLYDAIREIGEIYLGGESKPIGRTVAFLPSKGGSGSSTIAHNVGYALSRIHQADVVILDMDFPFGTAGLDFNQDPTQGIADALAAADRLDDVLLDRILSQCAENLSLLAAPATLDRAFDFESHAFSSLLDLTRAGVPAVVLDLPHQWSGWVRETLCQVDEIVVTALPDLASLRNTKNIIDQLKVMRPNDAPPKILINQVGVPKRPEIKADDFKKAIGLDPVAIIPFEPHLFGTAANNGQMIAELNSKSPVADIFQQIANTVIGRSDQRKPKGAARALAPLLSKFSIGRRKQA